MPVEVTTVYYAPLTGMPVSAEDYESLRGRRPLAVMLDNVQEAAPQAGVSQADVVVEGLVEGGITRLMAIFHSKDASLIEPVRSARTPFLYWTLELDALYVHIGSADLDGPADAGQQIRDWKVADLDFASSRMSGAYNRDPNRRAPHNVMTSSEALRQRARTLDYEREPAISPMVFVPAEHLQAAEPAPAFSVRFGSFSRFAPQWVWASELQRYLRSQYGVPHVDSATGEQLAFANVIVQYAKSWVGDASGHVLAELVGEGPAQIFTNGQMFEGTWRKADRTARTEFWGQDGQSLALLPGPTWIEVVPHNGSAIIEAFATDNPSGVRSH